MKAITQSYWKPSPHAYSENEDGRKLIIAGRNAALYDTDWNVLFHMHSRYNNMETFRNGFFMILGDVMEKWQPKPTQAFTRRDHGTIVVIGNEIFQFDRDMVLINRTGRQTYFAALQQAMLMVGGLMKL